MTSKTKRMLAAFSILTIAGSPLGFAADGPAFGQKMTFPTPAIEYAANPDGKAFTVYFIGFEVRSNDCNTKPVPGQPGPIHPTTPVVSRTATVVIPVTGGSQIKTPIVVQGYASTNQGGQATLLFSANGQNTVVNFPKNTDRDFIEKLEFSAASAAELRLTAVLLAECDGQYQGADAFISVNAIDSDIEVAKQRAASRTKK